MCQPCRICLRETVFVVFNFSPKTINLKTNPYNSSLSGMLQSNDLLDVLYRIKDSIVALDNNCTITYANQAYANIYGFDASEMIGKNVWVLLPKMVNSIVYEKVMEAMKTRAFQRFEWQGIYADKFWETTIFCSDKGITAISKDITQRRKAEEALAAYSKNLEKMVEEKTRQLRDSERLAAIGATAGMVGHDIRNPLQAMISDVYLLKDYLLNMPESQIKDEVTESLDGIERNITYINKIVADLQDYARPITPELSDFNLYELTTEVFAPITVPENTTPLITIDPQFWLESDPIILRRILTNLIINAIQAMPQGGNLSVSATKQNGKIVLAVKDTGVGIPEDVKPKLFTPMMTTKAKGQGLGLAVVKRLVEALGGSVSFESQEGQGTEFLVSLPTGQAKRKTDFEL